MAQTNQEQEELKQKRSILLCFALFAILLVSGILVKRVWGHPEYMTLFHLPAAIFLAMGGQKAIRRNKSHTQLDREIQKNKWTAKS